MSIRLLGQGSSVPITTKVEWPGAFRRAGAVSSLLVWPLGAAFVLAFGTPFHCVFHSLFHLHCPGCGSGRAVQALLHLRFSEALRQNILALPALSFLLWQHVDFATTTALGRRVLPRVRMGIGAYVRTILVVLVFWIARNIPLSPFTILAPR